MYVKDSDLKVSLDKNGFFTTPLLQEGDVKELLAIFEVTPKQVGAFTASAHLMDIETRKSINRRIKQIIEPKINELFEGIDVLGASFVIKSPNCNEILQPHQDWNIVDEKKHQSYNIWIPLVHTHKQNGGIMVMPGSHTWINSIRHFSIPCAYINVHKELLNIMTTLSIQAGNALVYDHRLLHASGINTTNVERIAIAVGIKPKNAEMRLYRNSNGKIHVFEANEDYFLEQNIFEEPKMLKKISEFSYDFPEVDINNLSRLAGIEICENVISKKIPWYKIYTPKNILKEIIYRFNR